ncbi:MAG: TonB family protein [Bacteroidetes bacterium]|nr:TonB family protein [Bacteroidota bacterium]
MKTIKIKYRIALSFLLLLSGSLLGQPESNSDKTFSPYFFVQSDDSEIDKLPLKSTSVEVNIAGVIADVKVKQVYQNEGSRPIEAMYVFPGSTRAAVYGMQMTIGERTIVAKIEERLKARQDYEEARQNGQSASLLEQQRPNVFQMNVANIMPGDRIVVELLYTELLIPEEGVYEFVYPTVVGPRYSNLPEDLASASDQWVSNPYTHEGEPPLYSFNLTVNLNAGMPVQDVVCPSHQADVQFVSSNEVKIDLPDVEKTGGNRDFILKYRLKGKQIQSGLLTYEGEEENFFLLMVQPPDHIKPEYIPPREYVFIVDVSGSMNGFPLDVSKTLLKDLIGHLRTSDKFNVLLFAGGSQLFSNQSVEANDANIKSAIQFLEKQRGGGGTELLPALKKALALKGTEDFSRTFVIATDGYVTVEKEAFDLIRENLGKANFFTFGIGSSVNRYIIEGMAHVGKGIPFVALDKNDARTLAVQFRNYVTNPVLTNIHVDFAGIDVYDVEPLEVPDVFSERPVLVYGKYRGNATGSVSVKGKTGSENFQWGIGFHRQKSSSSNSALKYLWARERIRLLDDYTNLAHFDDHADEMTALGLKYNLLTAYTSFIAIDSEVRNEGGMQSTVKQPLPLPQGVSNYAVGASNYLGGVQKSKSIRGSRADVLEEIALPMDGVMPLVDREENLDEDVVFIIAQKQPEFIGGEEALKKFLAENIIYPNELSEKGIQGTVYLKFIVNIKGEVEDVKVVLGAHELLDKEAIRIIKLTSGKWKPGEQKGKTVKVAMTLPIKFSYK